MAGLRDVGVVVLLLSGTVFLGWGTWLVGEVAQPCTPVTAFDHESVDEGIQVWQYENLSTHHQRLVTDAIAGLDANGTATFRPSDREFIGTIVEKNGTYYEIVHVADGCHDRMGPGLVIIFGTVGLVLLAGGISLWRRSGPGNPCIRHG